MKRTAAENEENRATIPRIDENAAAITQNKILGIEDRAIPKNEL